MKGVVDMTYKNPIVSGFYPDPSVCSATDKKSGRLKYYMATSSFQFFPGVPLLESDDLINWTQIGCVLNRKSQLPLDGAASCSGIFAPTIRYNNGRFYMVTTNTTIGGNFYVYTDDIYGNWSEPIFVEQSGIDPSLYFEDGKAYFMSNGTDADGRSGIFQFEIDIETGKKLSEAVCIWHGAGGRFLESPHMYKIGGYYYLMASEGGTEYGHMVVYARSRDLFGPFEAYPGNPVLTNRNMGGYQIQGCGHADLICDEDGNYYLLHLGFRQIDDWVMHHVTGREVYMTPVSFDKDGWFRAEDGVCKKTFELPGKSIKQKFFENYTFSNTKIGCEWYFLKNPAEENYRFNDGRFELLASDRLSDPNGNPTFVGVRQKEHNLTVSCGVSTGGNEAGITLYMTPDQHYEIAVRKTENGSEAFMRLTIGDISKESPAVSLSGDSAQLIIKATNLRYFFSVVSCGKRFDLGSAQTKFLSTEIAGNFTGVTIALYSQKEENERPEWSVFTDFLCRNDETD